MNKTKKVIRIILLPIVTWFACTMLFVACIVGIAFSIVGFIDWLSDVKNSQFFEWAGDFLKWSFTMPYWWIVDPSEI